MTAEYTTIGSLFQDFVGSVNWPIIITVGIVTMIYTMYGGLYISIVTDQVQAIVTIVFIAILSVYGEPSFIGRPGWETSQTGYSQGQGMLLRGGGEASLRQRGVFSEGASSSRFRQTGASSSSAWLLSVQPHIAPLAAAIPITRSPVAATAVAATFREPLPKPLLIPPLPLLLLQLLSRSVSRCPSRFPTMLPLTMIPPRATSTSHWV